jgi:putative transposase
MMETQFKDDFRFGKTPRERWMHITDVMNYVAPLPVTEEEWKKLLYVRSQRKLSRKTGISYDGLSYKGQALTALVNRVGEVEVNVLADPEDYRFIYVEMGPEEPLLELTEEYVDESSPAYSMDYYKRRLAEKRAEVVEHDDARQFRSETQAISVRVKKPVVRKSTSRNREATASHKESQAHKRAAENPAKSRKPVGGTPVGEAAPDVPAFSFDAIPAMPVYDHKTGTLKS